MTILDIVIEGKDEASGAFKSVDSSLGKLAGTAGKAATVGLGLAAAGVAAVGAAAIGAGVAALNLSTDINNATNNIATKMGISQDAAAGFEGVMKDIYANNFGENFDDIGTAISTISQNLGEMPDAALQGIAEDAFALRDAFEIDVGESVNSAKALMENFGLSGEQAMDFIASGMQNGLNTSGDFLDSLGEYSNLFADAGFSAEEMYNIMESGAQAGVLGTDKIADAVKEMGIILNEGGDDTKAAFDNIGLSFDDIAASVADGSADWGDYFDDIVGGINDIEDPMARSQAQTAIFGTMAEDLGASFTEGLTTAGTALDGMSGATEALNAQYDNWPSMFEGIKRNALLALEPLGDVLLDIGNRVMPIINDAFTWLQDNVAPIIQNIADVVTSFMNNLDEGMGPLDAFVDAMEGVIPQEVLDALIDLRDNIIPDLTAKFEEFVLPILAAAAEFVSFKDILIIVGAVIAGAVISALASFVVAIAPVLAVIAGAILIVATLRKAWETNFAGIRDFVAGVWDAIQTAFAAFKLLFQGNFTGFLAGINTAWEKGITALATFVGNLWDILKPKLEAFWITFKAWFAGIDWGLVGETILKAISAYIALHANIAKWILEKLTLMATAIFDWAKGVDWAAVATTILTAIGVGITALSGFVNQIGADIAAFIITGLTAFSTLVTAKLDEWVATFQAWAEDALTWENFGYLVAKAIIAGVDFIKELPAKLDEFWTSLTTWFDDQKFGDKGEQVSTKISEGLAQLWEDAKVKFGEMWTSIVAWFGEMDWKQLGIDVVQGIIDGINSLIGAAQEAIASIGRGITKAFEKDKEIDSPSKEFFRFGEMIILGLTKGIESSAQDPIDAMQELADKMTLEMISMVQSIIALVGPMLAALRLLSTFDIDSAKLIRTLDSFGDLIFHLGRIFAVAGWKLVIENRDMAKKMGEAMGPVVNAVVQAIEAFQLLGKAVFPTDLVGKITTLVDHIAYVAKQFAELAKGMTEELSNEMQNFNAAAASVMGLIGITIEAMTTLAAVDFGPIVQGMRLSEQIDTFKRIVRSTMLSFLEAAMLLDKEMSEQVGAFADAAGKVFGLVEIALSAIKLLADIDFGPIVGGLHLSDQIIIFRNITRTIMRQFAEAAGEMESELTDAIDRFVTAASNIFGMVEQAIEAIGQLSAADFGNILDIIKLLNNIETFKTIIGELVKAFADVAEDIETELLTKVTDFANAAGAIVGVIGPAVEAFASLSEFVRVDDLLNGVNAFGDDLLTVVNALGHKLYEIALFLAGVEVQVIGAATSVTAIVGIIGPAVEAFASLSEFVRVDDLLNGVNAFGDDLMVVINALGHKLYEISLFLAGVQTQVVDAATSVTTIIGIIRPTVEAFASLATMEDMPELNSKVTAFTDQLVSIVETLVNGLIDMPTTQDEVNAANSFASSITAILNSVLDILTSLDNLVNTNIPGGLQQILNDAIDILRASIPAAALAGYDFGMAWIGGIREALGTLSLDTGGGTQSLSFAGAAAGAGGAGGLTTNLNVGGLTFNTTISNQMDEDEFHFRVIETIRGLV